MIPYLYSSDILEDIWYQYDYARLYPPPPPTLGEHCTCDTLTATYIPQALQYNPTQCLHCEGNVPPDRLELSKQLAHDLATWHTTYNALYQLWMDSGTYERWALQQLLDPKGEVNTEGMELARQLSQHVPCYFGWFTEDKDQLSTACPISSTHTLESPQEGYLLCKTCNILLGLDTA